jgi:hypothetical protein
MCFGCLRSLRWMTEAMLGSSFVLAALIASVKPSVCLYPLMFPLLYLPIFWNKAISFRLRVAWSCIVYGSVCVELNLGKDSSHSFIPLARAECDNSLPFSGTSSIPLCYILVPSTLFYQLVFHPLSLHLAIYFLVYLLILGGILFSSILCTRILVERKVNRTKNKLQHLLLEQHKV